MKVEGVEIVENKRIQKNLTLHFSQQSQLSKPLAALDAFRALFVGWQICQNFLKKLKIRPRPFNATRFFCQNAAN